MPDTNDEPIANVRIDRNPDTLVSAITRMQDDHTKVEYLLRYIHKGLKSKNICEILNSISNEALRIEALEKVAIRMRTREVSLVIRKLENDEMKTSIMEKMYAQGKLHRRGIGEIIASIEDSLTVIEQAEKYEDILIGHDIRDIIWSSKGHEVKYVLLEKYLSKFDVEDFHLLCRTWREDEDALIMCASRYASLLEEREKKYDEEYPVSEYPEIRLQGEMDIILAKGHDPNISDEQKIELLMSFSRKHYELFMQTEYLDYDHVSSRAQAAHIVGRVIGQLKISEEEKNNLIEHFSEGMILSEKFTLIMSMSNRNGNFELKSKKIQEILASLPNGNYGLFMCFEDTGINGLNPNGIPLEFIDCTYVDDSERNYSCMNPEIIELFNERPRFKPKDLDVFFQELLIYLGQNIDTLPDLLERDTESIKQWMKVGFLPPAEIIRFIPPEKVSKIIPKIWYKISKVLPSQDDSSKLGFIELAFCFGVFDRDKVEIDGHLKTVDQVTNEERRSGKVNDAQKRLDSLLELIRSGALTTEFIHMMFSGTNLEFDAAFYRFFMENKDEILGNHDIMAHISTIHNDMSRIISENRGNIPTVEQCLRIISEPNYENINEGNQRLAKLCSIAGVSQETFEAYQMLYDTQKHRRKENSIPHLKGKNYEILSLTDPMTLVIGEGGFSKCCQRLGGAGEECMRHSATSENGRLVVIKDDEGRFIAQSWMWRNGNVVCFDSIEANAIESNTDFEQKMLVELIVSTYKQIAREMILQSQRAVEQFKKEKLEEIEREGLSDEEKQRRIRQLEQMCDDSLIKRVTVGQGYWRLSKKITERFSDREVHTANGRVYPLESISYTSDSDVQFIVDEIPGARIKTDKQVEILYRDQRQTITEKGEEINPDTIYKIKIIEAQAHKKQMQVTQNSQSVDDLAAVYECSPENLRVIHGEDWYYIYANNNSSIHIYDLARGKPRFEDEKSRGSLEMGRALELITLEAVHSKKDLEAELREDTSYIMLLEMVENGLIELVGEDEAFPFGGDEFDDEKRIVSKDEQKEILDRKDEIRAQAANEEIATMHHIVWRPTEKYIRYLEKRYAKKEADR